MGCISGSPSLASHPVGQDISRQDHTKVRVFIFLATSLLGNSLSMAAILPEGYSSFCVPFLQLQWVRPLLLTLWCSSIPYWFPLNLPTLLQNVPLLHSPITPI